MKSVDISAVPATLFSGAVFKPPSALSGAYLTCLNNLGLLAAAKAGIPKKEPSVVGGEAVNDTNNHFAWRFLNSATRAQRLLLDVDNSFANVPDELIQVLSGGDVVVLDFPGGCGGSLLGLIVVIAELRKHKLIPHLPLNLSVYCADISEQSLAIYGHMLDELEPALKAEGIHITRLFGTHDVLKIESVVELCDIWLQDNTKGQEHLVLIGNVGGLAKHSLDTIKHSFRHITERLLKRSASICWIEPRSRNNKSIIAMIKDILSHVVFLKFFTDDAVGISCEYSWHCPLADATVVSGMQLIDYVTVPNTK